MTLLALLGYAIGVGAGSSLLFIGYTLGRYVDDENKGDPMTYDVVLTDVLPDMKTPTMEVEADSFTVKHGVAVFEKDGRQVLALGPATWLMVGVKEEE